MRSNRFRFVCFVWATLCAGSAFANPSTSETYLNEHAAKEILQKARVLFDGLEYPEVLPLTSEVLEMESVSVLTRLDAYLLQGSCQAIVGNPVEAEKSFRFLLRATPDFEMPPETSPKIVAVFSKVQVEEKAIRDQVRALRRANLIKELTLAGEPEPKVTGGTPIEFGYNLKDRRGVVSSFQVHYRRASEAGYSSLPLKVNDVGRWSGEIPGQWSDNETGFSLEYFLITTDEEESPLLTIGAAATPLSLHVLPGTAAQAAPLYQQKWFWGSVAAGVAGIIATSVYGYNAATSLPNSPLGQLEIP